jgi:hypothetical protein
VASRSLGTLTLDIVAKIGGYTAGLDKAEKEAAKRAAAIEKVFDAAAIGVGVAFGAMAAAGTAAFAAISNGIESAAKYQDLAEEIGTSAEEIASFAVAAATAGVSIESVAGASVKLTKSLIGVDDESKAAGAALSAIGINIEEFKRLDPASQYEAVGKALAGYADGAGKTAVAVSLFGKSGAEQLKVFKALEEQGGRSIILTQEQIEAADRHADAQAKLRAEISLYASAAATQFIAPTEALIKVLIQAAQETGVLGGEATKLGQNKGVATFAEDAIGQLAFLMDAVQGVKVVFSRLGEFIGASAAAGAAFVKGDFEAVSSIRKSYDESLETSQFNSFEQKYRDALQAQKDFKRQSAAETRGFNPLAPVAFTGAAKKSGGGGAKDDPTKKLLDNELAAIKAQGEAAKELLSERNKFLDLYNAQGLLSVKDYYAALQANLDEATAAQAKAYDDQIQALKKFQAAAGKQTDVADAQGKINKLEEDKAKLYRASGTAAIESSIKQVQAQKAVKDAFDEVNAKVLEFQGNLRAAGEIRFDASNEKLITQAKAEQNNEVLKQIALLKEYTLAQADINKLQSQFSLAQGDLQIAEERISIARERGTTGEIESLKKSGEARKKQVAILEEQIAAFDRLGDATKRSAEQNQAVERLRVQLEGLKATLDPLADKFNTLFADAAGSAFSDFINSTKTAKEAFKSFTDTIFKELVNLAAKEVFKSFFGKGGASTGGVGLDIGGLLSSFFGGGTGGGADVLGDFIKGRGFASGGFTGSGAANDPAGFVHKGEFVVNAANTNRLGLSALQALNNGGTMGGNVFNISVPESVNRNTGTQIAAEAQRKLAQGQRNR